jgi:hypothetical protein
MQEELESRPNTVEGSEKMTVFGVEVTDPEGVALLVRFKREVQGFVWPDSEKACAHDFDCICKKYASYFATKKYRTLKYCLDSNHLMRIELVKLDAHRRQEKREKRRENMPRVEDIAKRESELFLKDAQDLFDAFNASSQEDFHWRANSLEFAIRCMRKAMRYRRDAPY